MHRFAAEDPAHGWIMPKSLGIVQVLITGKMAKYGLPQHADKRMPAINAGADVGERFARYRGKSECVVEFSIGEQAGVGSDYRAEKLHHQENVIIESERLAIRFTRRVCHSRLVQ